MPTTDPSRAFDPSRADLRLECGTFLCNRDTVVVQLNLHVNGAGEAHYSLAMQDAKGRQTIAFMGLAEWNALIAATDEGRKLLARLMGSGRVNEITPCPPG